MKKCTWCGKDYPDEAELCEIDQQPLEGGEPPQAEPPSPGGAKGIVPVEANPIVPVGRGFSGAPRRLTLIELDSTWRPEVLDLAQIQDAFVFAESYSRPDWKVIRQAIESVPPEKLAEAWVDAGIQWVQRVGADLGGQYRLRCSDEFILLSALDTATAEQLLIFAERTLERIYSTLKDAAWQWGDGKHVVLLFADADDYYQYVSWFNQDGIHPASGGCLIHKGYVHIAMPYLTGRSIRQSLTHELLHNSVVHLRLPLWLNEGLAVVFDRTAGQRRPILDDDLRDRHLAFWNAQNIQKFWAGVSFREPGDSNELSYSLAEIILNLLLSESKEVMAFVKQADWKDAGQKVAVELLGTDLGQTMATFLGEGNWQPDPKVMAEVWGAAEKKDEKASARCDEKPDLAGQEIRIAHKVG
jgi:hypothetical protein